MTRIRSSRRFVAALLAAGLVCSVVNMPVANADSHNPYRDVPAGVWYDQPARWSYHNKITGITGDLFRPDRSSTRGETAVWLWNMMGSPASSSHGFTDVPSHQSQAVAWMSETGITTGTTPTTFSPNNGLTRGQLAAFLWRLAGRPSAPSHSFVDVTASWQQQPVSWLSRSGITTGTTPTTFSPNSTLTRAHLVTFVYRYSQRFLTQSPDGPVIDSPDFGGEQRQIVVPETAPSGRCGAGLNGSDIYDWEYCAWKDYRFDTAHNWSLSENDAVELLQQIWSEVNVEGRPASVPTVSHVPLGGECATFTENGLIVGCYQPAAHHIRLQTPFTETLLHETAHALVADHPSIIQCGLVPSSEYQACVHNDIFRCVADYLYTTYARIPTAGVCGTTDTDSTGGYTPTEWGTYKYTDTGEPFAGVLSGDLYDSEGRDITEPIALLVDCNNVVLSYEATDPPVVSANTDVRVTAVFVPDEYWEWEDEQRIAFENDHGHTSNWALSRSGQSVIPWDRSYLTSWLQNPPQNDLVIFYQQTDGEWEFQWFPTAGAAPHIEEVLAQCDGGTGAPTNSGVWRTDEASEWTRVIGTVDWVNGFDFNDETIEVWLVVSCHREDQFLSVWVTWFNGTTIRGTTASYGLNRAEGAYAAGENRLRLTNWSVSSFGDAVFLPDSQHTDFINELVDPQADTMWISVDKDPGSYSSLSTESASAFIPTAGSYDHVRYVTEQCGWSWS